MEIVDAYFQLGHTSTIKKVEAFLYGNCGGISSVRAYLHSKKSGGIPIQKL